MKKLSKIKVIAAICIPILIIAAIGLNYYIPVKTEENNENEIKRYLAQEYYQGFIVKEKMEEIPEEYPDAKYIYKISPQQNENIIFVAGKTEAGECFDTFFEETKKYFAGNNEYVITDVDTIETITKFVYDKMVNIKSGLESLGFSANNLTCAVDIAFTVNGHEGIVSFDDINKEKIADQIAVCIYGETRDELV